MDRADDAAPVVIVGAGGLGREVRDLLTACGRQVAGFLDDAPPEVVLARPGTLAVPLLGSVEAGVMPGAPFALGLGWPEVRLSVVARLAAAGRPACGPAVHPSAVLGRDVELGRGTLVTAGCVITTDVALGDHVLVNIGSTIGHDVRVGTGTSIMPGVSISGGVRLGAGVMVGSRAFIREGVEVGDGATIGAGAVVLTDVAASTTVVGMPARPRDGR